MPVMAGIVLADDRTITVFEISVTRDTTAVNLNIPADFHFRNIVSKNQIEITFDNCGVNLLGNDSILVPSFSPLFDYVELKETPDSRDSKLIIQLASDSGKPQIFVKQSMQSVSFEFRKEVESLALIADESEVDVSKSKEKEPEIPAFRIDPEESTIPFESDDPTEPVMADSYDDLGAILEGKELIKGAITSSDGEQIEPIHETSSDIVEMITVNHKENELEAVHYSEGRIDKDTLTFEFSGASPEFFHDMIDSKTLMLTLHNVIVPPEILPDDSIRKQISGTFLRMISLERFEEAGIPGLKVVLQLSSVIDIKINDLGGVMEVVLLRKSN